MADEILVKVDVGDVSACMLQWAENSKRLEPTMEIIATDLQAAVGDVFEAEGPGWAPLAESTKRSRRGTEPYKILQDKGGSGGMSGSIGTGWGPAYAEAFDGTPYGIFHVLGNEHLPVRDPFDLGPFWDDLLADAADLVAGKLVE